MGYQILQIEKAVAAHEMRFADQPGFLDHLRRAASRELADKIAADASLYRRIDPDPEEKDNPFAVVRHRWKIGIQTDKDELEARERDMAQARREGMKAAALMVLNDIEQYRRTDGPCKWVIMQQLRDTAKNIDDAANQG